MSEVLKTFVHKYGAMEQLIYDGAPEQIGRKTEFQRMMRKYDIRVHVAESGRSKQNPVEVCIREL